MERKSLKNTHRELIGMKRERIAEANLFVKRRMAEFGQTLDLIASELGVPKGKFKLWRLNQTDEYIEKVGVSGKIPSKKKGKKK